MDANIISRALSSTRIGSSRFVPLVLVITVEPWPALPPVPVGPPLVPDVILVGAGVATTTSGRAEHSSVFLLGMTR
jgi:hypothetical protein